MREYTSVGYRPDLPQCRVSFPVPPAPPLPALPVVNWSADPVTGPAPLEVQFTNATTGVVDSFAWNLGNGTSGNANPVSVYAEGTYTVSLTAYNAAGSAVLTRENYIVVTAAGETIQLLNGLVHYFSMEEAEGAARTDSAGAALLEEAGASVPRVSGKNGYAAAPDDPSQSLAATGFSFSAAAGGTVSFWYAAPFDDMNAFGVFTLGSVHSVSFEVITTLSAHEHQIRIVDGQSNVYTLDTDVSGGGWHHVALRIDASGQIQCYLDGAYLDDAGVGEPVVSPFTSLEVGSAGLPGYGVLVDEMAFWSRLLSEDEIAYLYNSGAGRYFADFE